MNPSGDANGCWVAEASGISGNAAGWPVDDHSAPMPEGLAESVIDRNHLARMTLGDGNLEREILGLFRQQAGMLLVRMASDSPKVIAGFAHTLTGSARSRASAAAATGRDQGRIASALRHLSTAVARAQAAIADLTQAC